MLQSLVSEDPNPITFKEQDGMDFAATTVKLPDGEYVPWRTRWSDGKSLVLFIWRKETRKMMDIVLGKLFEVRVLFFPP